MGKSCRLLPHGSYALVPTVLCCGGWVASVFQDGCDYAIIEGPVVQKIIDDDDAAVPWLEVGYDAYRTPEYIRERDVWEVTYSGHCTDYDLERVELDPAWKAAKAFAFLALVLGGGGALFLWFSACCVFSKATWRWAGYEVLLAAIFQALAFLWFGNSMCHYRSTCTLSWGSKSDIVACALWALAALAIFLYYPPPTLPPPDQLQQRPRGTTNPVIAVTGLEPANQHHPQIISLTNLSTTKAVQSYAGSSQVAAALPLEGDPTATMPSPAQHDYDGLSGRKDLNDVEVL